MYFQCTVDATPHVPCAETGMQHRALQRRSTVCPPQTSKFRFRRVCPLLCAQAATKAPYKEWLKASLRTLKDLGESTWVTGIFTLEICFFGKGACVFLHSLSQRI